jgi:hypothetical protein
MCESGWRASTLPAGIFADFPDVDPPTAGIVKGYGGSDRFCGNFPCIEILVIAWAGGGAILLEIRAAYIG